ncbi:MAG: hypothetical protein Q4G69_13645 [Planctomycetia bacterium]|nr:hypothetical protein [Planctomycetia bacterium]
MKWLESLKSVVIRTLLKDFCFTLFYCTANFYEAGLSAKYQQSVFDIVPEIGTVNEESDQRERLFTYRAAARTGSGALPPARGRGSEATGTPGQRSSIQSALKGQCKKNEGESFVARSNIPSRIPALFFYLAEARRR